VRKRKASYRYACADGVAYIRHAPRALCIHSTRNPRGSRLPMVFECKDGKFILSRRREYWEKLCGQ